MAFVAGYEHDVFISYAHIDNEPAAGAHQGWVTLLCRELRKNLAVKLGAKALDVWMDPRLSPNVPLDDELRNSLERSAVLLIVLSPAYQGSEWCGKERQTFLDLVKNRPCGVSSIFVVEKDRVSELPPKFAELGIGVRFWKEDADDPEITHTFGWPEPDKDDPYWDMLVKLATKLEKHLRQQSPRDAGRPASDMVTAPRLQTPHGPSVFVAHASDVLFDERQQLINYLEQAGLTVYPEGEYGVDPESVTQLTKQHLSSCKVFAQLLSSKPGRRGPAFPLGFAGLQYELARAAGIKIIQWRDPALDRGSVGDDAYRALLDGPNVMACGLEEFKAAVVTEAKREVAAVQDVASRSVVISAVKEDARVADELQAWLLEQEIGVMKWVDRETVNGDGNLKRFADTLKASDAFFVVCGPDTDPSWLTRKVKDGRRYGAQRKPATRVALYDRRAPDDALEIALPGAQHLDFRAGFNEAELRTLLAGTEA